jgi:hypothetical protein
MSSAQGRFTSPDQPFADQHPDDPQTWNLYSYTRNNPLKLIDTDGRQVACATAGTACQNSQYWAQQNPKEAAALAAGIGTAGVASEATALYAAGRALFTGLAAWALGHPQEVQETAAGIGEGLSNAAPGSLTSGFARLGTTTAESVDRKLSTYLLDVDHPHGGDKAQWFQQALGFTKDNMADLAKQIVFDPKKAVQTGVTEFGTKYNQTIAITGANGKTINVVAAWIRNPDNVVRLVTAVPAK